MLSGAAAEVVAGAATEAAEVVAGTEAVDLGAVVVDFMGVASAAVASMAVALQVPIWGACRAERSAAGLPEAWGALASAEWEAQEHFAAAREQQVPCAPAVRAAWAAARRADHFSAGTRPAAREPALPAEAAAPRVVRLRRDTQACQADPLRRAAGWPAEARLPAATPRALAAVESRVARPAASLAEAVSQEEPVVSEDAVLEAVDSVAVVLAVVGLAAVSEAASAVDSGAASDLGSGTACSVDSVDSDSVIRSSDMGLAEVCCPASASG